MHLVQTTPRAFKRVLVERTLGTELSHYLGYPPGQAGPEDNSSHRNGVSGKTVVTHRGLVPPAAGGHPVMRVRYATDVEHDKTNTRDVGADRKVSHL